MTHKGGRLLSTLVCFLFSYLTLTLEHYTLELYAARIFDNPKWVDYEAFAKHYGYQPQSYEG